MIKKIKRILAKIILKPIDKIAYNIGGYQRAKVGYQDQRFPHDQYELISDTDEYKQLKNSLEIGCNQGKLVKSMANDGLFASGIDLEEYWKLHDNGKAILGVYNFNEKDVSKLPIYDAILLLSVHHQWVNKNSEEYAKNVVKNLLGKTRICMFIEFAAIASKYGYQQGEKFQDNDEESVKKYAENWLKEAGVYNYTYIVPGRIL